MITQSPDTVAAAAPPDPPEALPRAEDDDEQGPVEGEAVLGAGAAAVVAASGLAACGGSGSGAPELVWYINPDSGGQAEIAARCTEAAEGRYTISTALLPREASAQREQLVRRLAANDSSIDIMSLDPPFIPEFAEAGFLAPVPEDVAERVTEDVVESAIEGSTWDGRAGRRPVLGQHPAALVPQVGRRGGRAGHDASRSPGTRSSRRRRTRTC